MKNLSRHTDLLCQLETSLLMRGNQIGEMSELSWLIGLVKHAIWADSLYFLYLLLLSISRILALTQRTLFPAYFGFLRILFLALKETAVYPGSLTKYLMRKSELRLLKSLQDICSYNVLLFDWKSHFVRHPFFPLCAVTIALSVVLLLQSDHNPCPTQWVSTARNRYTVGYTDLFI
jgi:hypothetical protein